MIVVHAAGRLSTLRSQLGGFLRHPLACYRLVSTPVRAHPSVSRRRQLSTLQAGVLVTPGAHGVRSPLVAAVVQPPEPFSDAYEHALAAERLRSARVLGLLRFVGITIASGLNLLLPEVMHETRALQADVRLFSYYWLAAAAVFWANRRSGRIAHLVGLDIAVVDMPFVFLLQWNVVGRNPGVAAPAVWSVVFYMLLIMAAAFSLQTWRIFLAAGIGGALEVVLLSLAHVDRQFIAGTVAVIGGVAAICAYNVWRTIHLVRSVADEHRRRERLARYFSPAGFTPRQDGRQHLRRRD